MSRGQEFARFNAGARRYLDPDIGPVENEGCAVGACEDDAVYRVPWPEFACVVVEVPSLAQCRRCSPQDCDSE